MLTSLSSPQILKPSNLLSKKPKPKPKPLRFNFTKQNRDMVDIKRQTNDAVVAISTVMAVLAKRASRLPRKVKAAVAESGRRTEWRSSVLEKPKKLVSKISRKTTSSLSCGGEKKSKKKGEEWGESGGVWQKEIMMGDKCVPLDFKGKQVKEIPVKPQGANAVTGYFIRHRQPKLCD